jgi:hypothetical protein
LHFLDEKGADMSASGRRGDTDSSDSDFETRSRDGGIASPKKRQPA